MFKGQHNATTQKPLATLNKIIMHIPCEIFSTILAEASSTTIYTHSLMCAAVIFLYLSVCLMLVHTTQTNSVQKH